MPKKTALTELHRAAGAKMVDFAGWEMPIHYGSQLEEHHQVRRDAGMFDVSHMTVVDLQGTGARDYLRHLLANDVAKLTTPGKALYSCMLTRNGGVIDDLIVYYLDPKRYRMVVNAATREKDLAWLQQIGRDFDLRIQARPELAMIAVQGPNARSKVQQALGKAYLAAADLKPFSAYFEQPIFIARTGYTGEDGYELILAAEPACELWRQLAAAGVKPIGLGARDTLRLEAGMNLYGQDMDERTSPLESGLSWTVALDDRNRQFIGRAAYESLQQSGPRQKLVGLILRDKGVLRHEQRVITQHGDGIITSGGFSPTLQQSIALARVPVESTLECQVDIRNRFLNADMVKPPFVRHGKSCYKAGSV